MPTDAQSRQLIVNDLKSNYFVEASAGSGKTYSLVLRMVAMIEDGVPVDQICTITFTKAAAAEFFSRFQQALSVRSVSRHYDIDDHLPPKTEISMARCKEALANIDLCFLGTIDAFCNMIAHELPTELEIPSDAEVISNDDRAKLLEARYEEILKDDTNPNHQKALLLNRFYKPRDLFIKAANYLGDLRNGAIPYDKTLVGIDINNYFKSIKTKFLKYVEGLCSNAVEYKPKKDLSRNDKYKSQTSLRTLYPKINIPDWTDALSDIDFALKQIKDMEGFASTVIDTDLDTKYKLIKIPDRVTASSAIRYSDDAKECFEAMKNAIDDYKFAVLFDLVTPILHETFDGFKEEGKLGYFDYQYYLNNALRKDYKGDKRIINHILKRHSKFLLDESQDTNPIQTELFFYLTGTNQAAKDWTDNKPKDGSLFIVGDPKQSIYAFRNANVGAFNRIKNIFAKEGKVLVLTENFRSKEILKEWFNESMNDVLNHGVEPLVHLDIPINQSKKQKQEDLYDTVDNKRSFLYQGVYKYTVKDRKEDCEAVAKFIISLVNDPNKYIEVKNKKTDKNEVRRITYGDIRVVPRTTTVKGYVDAFNTYGIPVTIEADIPFDRSETLLNAVELVSLLKSPNDKAALLNVLYGSLFKFNDYDIVQMKANGFDFDISKELVNFSNKKHQEAIGLLNYLYNQTKGFSFSSCLLFVLNNKELNIYDKISSDFLEYTFYLIEKVKEKEEAGLMNGVEQFKEYVQDFIGGDTDDNRTIRFKNEANKVILANVHKVKGLQAPIVILCGPVRGGKRSVQRVDYSSGSPVANIAGINDSYTLFVERHNVSPNEQKTWDAYERAEDERVEYVGATRAESVLIVADKIAGKPSTSNYPDYNPWGDLIRNIPDSNSINVPDVQAATVDPDVVSLNQLQNFDESKKVSIEHVSPSKKAHDFKAESTNDNIDDIKENNDSGTATLMGTLVHKLMECLVSSKGSYTDLDALVNQIVNEYHAVELFDQLKEIAKQITSGGFVQKKSSLNADILATLKDAEEVYCETPFSYRKGNEVISGIIDLIYKDKNGYHIIDYKTNKFDNVAMLEDDYKEQLNDYVLALKEMGVEADAHIYHINIR